MKDFWGGCVIGAIGATLGLVLLAKMFVDGMDTTCMRQDWKGEACQCRLLEKKDSR